jgi:hypothetical protein
MPYPDGARYVPYTVWSRGRLIGDTDLGFIRLIDVQRSGSFHPNPEGERLMQTVASPLPAMRAYLHRDARDASGGGFVLPELQGSALFADLAESFQRFQALELELRREDGSVVPTDAIGFQDTHELLALAEREMDTSEDDVEEESWLEDGFELIEGTRELEMDVLHDLEALDGPPGDWADEFTASWAAEKLGEIRLPRYQIHVMLLHGNSIP